MVYFLYNYNKIIKIFHTEKELNEYYDQCVKDTVYKGMYMTTVLFVEICTFNDRQTWEMDNYEKELSLNYEHWELMEEKYPWFFPKNKNVINEIKTLKPNLREFHEKYKEHVLKYIMKNKNLYDKALKRYLEKHWKYVKKSDYF